VGGGPRGAHWLIERESSLDDLLLIRSAALVGLEIVNAAGSVRAALPSLRQLSLNGVLNVPGPGVSKPGDLDPGIVDSTALDLRPLRDPAELQHLEVANCELVGGLAPVADMHKLISLDHRRSQGHDPPVPAHRLSRMSQT
jgi:hypothetical protein